VKIGLQIIRFDWSGAPATIASKLTEIASAADAAGFASLWVMDHFFQMGDEFGPADDPMLEGYITAAHLAAATRQTRVGVLVTGNIYRHPGLLVKMATTLDVLSGGRAYFGIGAGWYEREARGLGMPFPPVGRRFEWLEEALQIAHHMWRGDRSPFAGKYYQLAEPINTPPPLTRPHPPILIGGEGERKTLRLVAQYGDACNLHLGHSLAEFGARERRLKHKLDVLRQHCDAVGRAYDAIERTALGSIALTLGDSSASEVIKVCEKLAGLGYQHVIFNMRDVHAITPLEIFGREIIPEVAAM
jgi:F420-dependent oxidoreductase-like protein